MPDTILKRWNGTAFEELYPKTTTSQIVASGTASSSTFLRGDGQWAVPAGVDSYVNITGDTMSGALTINNILSAQRYYQAANGVPTGNLGNPTVTEMALFDEQFYNQTAFYDISRLKFYSSTNGTTWTEITTITDGQKRTLVGGDNGGGVAIPNLTPYYRIEITNNGNYVFLNALYLYMTTSSHATSVKIKARRRSDLTFVDFASSNSTVNLWPGHVYLPFSTIPYLTGGSSSGHYDIVHIDFQPIWSGDPTYGTQPIFIQKLQIWGGYPAGKRNVFSTDENANVAFPAALTGTRLISTVATGTSPLAVTSTTVVTNLNADLLDGVQGTNYFRVDGTYPNTDMNITVEGYWHVEPTAANLPIAEYGHRWDYDHLNNGQWVAQFYSATTGTDSLWFRQKRNHVAQPWQKLWSSTNDGTGSGLDADLLDGNHAAAFALASHTHTYANLTGTVPTWNQNTTGSSASTTFVNSPDGDRVAGNKLPTSNPRTVRFDFATSGSVGAGNTGNYAGVMTYAPWDGTTSSTGDSSYQLAFVNDTGGNGTGLPGLRLRKGIDSTWGSWNKIWHEGNDGSGSSLDADFLDGLHSTAFIRRDIGDIAIGNHEFYATAVSGNYDTAAIEIREVNLVNNTQTADAYAPSLSWHWGGITAMKMFLAANGQLNVAGATSGQIWHSGNDGASSGLDADLLDGNHASAFLLTTARGAANGVAPLGADSRVPLANLPAFLTGASKGFQLVSTLGANTTLSTLITSLGGLGGNGYETLYGAMWVATTTLNITWTDQTTLGPVYTYHVLSPGDEGDATSPVTLESGDIIVFTKYSATGGSSGDSDDQEFTFSVINNNDPRFANYVPLTGGNITGNLNVSGNVGIGTTSPATKLSIVGAGANGIQLGTSTEDGSLSQRLFFTNSTATNTIVREGSVLQFRTGATVGSASGTVRMVINDNGNVGIGTSTPSSDSPLHIQSAATGAVRLRMKTTSTTGSPEFIAFNDQDQTITTGIYGSANAAYGIIGAGQGFLYSNSTAINIASDNANGAIKFGVGTSIPERMRITAAGNVGIGRTDPAERLEVSGSDATTFSGLGLYNTLPYGDGNKAESMLKLGKIEGNVRQPMGAIGASPTNNGDSSSGYMSFYTRLSQAMTERMRITNNGNVGIGTVNPSTILNIRSATAQEAFLRLQSTDASGSGRKASVLFNLGGTDRGLVGFVDATANNFEVGNLFTDGNTSILAGNAERMRITSAGNVGIGTTTPGHKLTLPHSSNIAWEYGTGDAFEYTTIGKGDGGVPLAFKTTWTGSPTNKIYAFYGLNSSSVETELLTILNGGNVGIGTTSPQGTLHVQATNTGLAPLLRLGNLSIANNTTKQSGILFELTDTIGSVKETSRIVSFTENAGNAIDAGMFFATRASDTITERMRITGAGNVGIGTASPASKLDVNGESIFRGPLLITTDATNGNYNEGIRLAPAANGWTGIAFNGTGFSGAPSWFVARNPSNQFIIASGDSSTTSGLALNAAGDMNWRNNKVWHAGNDGTGSTLDADLLDGNHASAFLLTSAVKEQLKYLYIYGKAQSAITKGQAVQFAGVQGDHILMKPAVPSEINANPDYFIGLAESTLATNDFGYILTQGELVNVNTSTYTAGNILWFASAGSTAGAITATEPTGTNAKIQVGAVTKVNATEGIILTRMHIFGVEIADISASGTASNTTFLRGDGAWSSVTASNVGLGNVTNESKATMFTNAALTSTPTAPTATAGTNTTQIATTAFVSTAVANLINSAPGALDTLDELAAALGDDANFASTITTLLAGKAATSHTHTVSNISDRGNIGNNLMLLQNTTTSTRFVKLNPDHSVSLESGGTYLTSIGLGNVTNESKATMFSSPTFTGTVSGVTATMVGLGNVTNESKATMFASPTFTGTVSGITAAMVGAAATSHTHTATAISDSGNVGRNLLTTSSATASTLFFKKNPDHTITLETDANFRTSIGAAAASHTHGNISNAGVINTNTAASTGQHLVITSDADLIQQSAITFGTQTTTFLRNDGTWVNPDVFSYNTLASSTSRQNTTYTTFLTSATMDANSRYEVEISVTFYKTSTAVARSVEYNIIVNNTTGTPTLQLVGLHSNISTGASGMNFYVASTTAATGTTFTTLPSQTGAYTRIFNLTGIIFTGTSTKTISIQDRASATLTGGEVVGSGAGSYIKVRKIN